MFSFISLTAGEIDGTVILKFKGPVAQSSPLITKIVKQGFQVRGVKDAQDEIHLTLKTKGKSLEECKTMLKEAVETFTFNGQNLATAKPQLTPISLQQAPASDDRNKYTELFAALKSGEEKALDTFRLFPEDKQKRIWEQFTMFLDKTLLHAAIEGGLPERIVEIIQIDRELRPEGPLLTCVGDPKPVEYGRTQQNGQEDQLKVKKLIECVKKLINQPIDNNGNTLSHQAINDYSSALQQLKDVNVDAWRIYILNLAVKYEADFTLKNKEGKSPLDLILDKQIFHILKLFYLELCKSLEKGDQKIWNQFKTFPDAAKKSILEQAGENPKKTVLHAAMDGQLFEVMFEIIEWDKKLRPEGPLLTWLSKPHLCFYARTKKGQEKDALKREKIIDCTKKLVNEPIDNEGTTPSHLAVKDYIEAATAEKPDASMVQSCLINIISLFGQYESDFTVKNKAGKNTLDLILDGKRPEILQRLYIELFQSLEKGDRKIWARFKTFSPQAQKSILHKMDVIPNKTLLHAAVKGGIPEVIVEIIELDTNLYPQRDRLTYLHGKENLIKYGQKKIREEKDDLKKTQIVECIKKLVNEPIDMEGNTELHLAVKNYIAAVTQKKPAQEIANHYGSIKKLLATYGADFTVKNKLGKSSLDLLLEGDYPDLFMLFVNNDRERKLYNTVKKSPPNCLEELVSRHYMLIEKHLREISKFFANNFGDKVYSSGWGDVLYQIFPGEVKLAAEEKIEIGKPTNREIHASESRQFGINIKIPINFYLFQFFESLIQKYKARYSNQLSNFPMRIALFGKSFNVQIKFILHPERTWSTYYAYLHHLPWMSIFQETIEECKPFEIFGAKDNLAPFKQEVEDKVHNITHIPPLICQIIAEYCCEISLIKSPEDSQVTNSKPHPITKNILKLFNEDVKAMVESITHITLAICQIIAEYCWEMSLIKSTPEDFQVMNSKQLPITIAKPLQFIERQPILETCLNSVLQEQKKLEVFHSIDSITQRVNFNDREEKSHVMSGFRFFLFAAPAKKPDQKPGTASQLQVISTEEPKKNLGFFSPLQGKDQNPKHMFDVNVEDCENVILFMNTGKEYWQVTYPNPLFQRR